MKECGKELTAHQESKLGLGDGQQDNVIFTNIVLRVSLEGANYILMAPWIMPIMTIEKPTKNYVKADRPTHPIANDQAD